MARLIVVVDDDVDPSNLAEVLWAITTRCEPSEQIDIIRDAWSSTLDPRIPPEKKTAGITSHSKAIIDACRPFAWKDKFPPTSSLTQDEARKIEAKWGIALKGQRY
jgi:3-polyprenyl-4-hydroxybenzoate decarboxylase